MLFVNLIDVFVCFTFVCGSIFIRNVNFSANKRLTLRFQFHYAHAEICALLV